MLYFLSFINLLSVFGEICKGIFSQRWSDKIFLFYSIMTFKINTMFYPIYRRCDNRFSKMKALLFCHNIHYLLLAKDHISNDICSDRIHEKLILKENILSSYLILLIKVILFFNNY